MTNAFLSRRNLLIILVLLGCIGWFGWRMGGGLEQTTGVESSSEVLTWQGRAPTLTVTDAEEIFKKGFWRRPTPDDLILHAERHEWSDENGLQRWQWFLVVEASESLIQYLRDDNAFGLVAASKVVQVDDAPAWFRFDPEKVSTLQSPNSGMRLWFNKTDNTLYATASGRGFTKGAPEPKPAAQGTPTPSRIPNTPPPRPK